VTICALVLAAGRSERMGTQKLLLPLGGKPVIARIVDELQRSALREIVVVIGRDGEKIQQALKGRAVTFVTNPDFTGDMLGSVRCGLRAIPAGCVAMLVVLGDQPNLTSQLVRKLIGAFKASGRGIIVPTHNGHRGHPLLIATRFRDELLSCHEEVGLHGLLDEHREEVFRLEIADAAVLIDMDTPEDYRRHLSSIAD
jgi:molybdenum cofactor cytidylyltransferase